MKATEILEQEHRIIEPVASACGVCAEVLRGGGSVPPDALGSIVGFFRQYGDQYHRQEEEMLPCCARRAWIPEAAPLP